MTLLFLRTGDRVSYEANEAHKQQVQAVIGELTQRLREEENWQPRFGEQCDRCQYPNTSSTVRRYSHELNNLFVRTFAKRRRATGRFAVSVCTHSLKSNVSRFLSGKVWLIY
ncbi:MAG: hypothetical protein AAF810_02345 [Cyanobacteria bacterium P01_D01_bin.36]